MSKDNQNGEATIIKISGVKRLRCIVDTFKGKKQLSIREQYKDEADDEDWNFGKAGLNIRLDKIDAEKLMKLAKFIKSVADNIDELNEDEDEKPKKKKKKKDDEDDEDD